MAARRRIADEQHGEAGGPLGRLALSKSEAAGALGVSVDFLEEHVLHELRIVRCGRRRPIPVRELERWLEQHAVLATDGRRGARGAAKPPMH